MSRNEKDRLIPHLNKYLLLGGIIVLTITLGTIWLGFPLTLLLTALVGLSTLAMPHVSSRWVMKVQNGKPINPYLHRSLYQMITNLSNSAGLPSVPQLYIIPSRQLNAFALGQRNEPVVGLTSGLLAYLNERQLYGVLAHEISHIKNNDLTLKSIASAISKLADGLSLLGKALLILSLPMYLMGIEVISLWAITLLILSPLASTLLQLGISRNMEFIADQDAATLTGDPVGLASALKQIHSAYTPWWRGFQWNKSQTNDWLSSHPDTKTRVDRLMAMFHELHQNPQTRLRPMGMVFNDFLASGKL